MTLNVSTGRSVSVNSLYEIIKKAAGCKDEPLYGPPRPGDIRDSLLSCKKAEWALGWTAGTELEQGIKNTLEHNG